MPARTEPPSWRSLERRRRPAARQTHAAIARRCAGATDPALRDQAARALVSQGVELVNLGRLDEALTVYEDVARRYAEPGQPAHRNLAWSLANEGHVLVSLGRDDE